MSDLPTIVASGILHLLLSELSQQTRMLLEAFICSMSGLAALRTVWLVPLRLRGFLLCGISSISRLVGLLSLEVCLPLSMNGFLEVFKT